MTSTETYAARRDYRESRLPYQCHRIYLCG
jgi:hypothetical protein